MRPRSPTGDEAIQAREAFIAVVDAAPAERSLVLNQLHVNNPPIAELVVRMLEADSHSGPALLANDQPLLDLDVLLTDIDSGEPGLPDLGPGYAPLRLLGAGSAGEVYAARQTGAVNREVAIKLFRPFGMNDARRVRFETEARAMTALTHPGIAQIFGTEVTPDGRPFLVMELVPGTPIPEACRHAELDWRVRAELIAKLCRIVHHAHQRGIIHRDLKPRNILAQVHNGVAEVKVIDFGLARLTTESGFAHHELTMTGQLLGTLAYMSPEQLRGEPADARSDIFAIGLILIEVLSNHPLAPRVRLAEASISGDRADLDTLLDAIPVRVRRDLLTIVRCATAGLPADRFPSAAHLADELDRVLRGDPILTRPLPLYERLMRFIRRSPGTTVITGLLMIACFSLIIALTLSRSDLDREFRTQRAMISGMLDDVLDQLEDRSGAASARRALVPPLRARADDLRRRAPNDVSLLEAAARLALLDGDVTFETGHHLEAIPAFTEAAALFTELAIRSGGNLEARRRAAVAIIRIGDMLLLDDPESSIERYVQALAMHEALHDAYPEHLGVLDDLSWSHHRIGILHLGSGRFDKASHFIEARLSVARKLLDLDPNRLASAYTIDVRILRIGSPRRNRGRPRNRPSGSLRRRSPWTRRPFACTRPTLHPTDSDAFPASEDR